MDFPSLVQGWSEGQIPGEIVCDALIDIEFNPDQSFYADGRYANMTFRVMLSRSVLLSPPFMNYIKFKLIEIYNENICIWP